jgi:putative ABC transport system permease protein
VDGPENRIGTQGFDTGQLASVREVSGVSELRPYRLTYLDFDERRVFVIGYAPGVTRQLSGNEFIGGDRQALSKGLPRVGDVAVSQALAKREKLRLGQRFNLPTPTGTQRVRYVATISNYGWQAGAITMGGTTFTKAWGSQDASMLGVKLSPGADLAAVDKQLRAQLGAESVFRVETPEQGVARGRENVELALARLKQIELAVLIGAILAMTASALTAVSQRRRRIAGLRAIGMSPSQTATALFVEVGFVLAVGALVGVALGLAGQRILLTTFEEVGFPVQFAIAAGPMLAVLAALTLIAVISTVLSTREAVRRSIVDDLAFE